MSIHDKLAKSHPDLVRGIVHCVACHRTVKVDSAECLRSGWPKCCGSTMRLGAPEPPKREKTKSPPPGRRT